MYLQHGKKPMRPMSTLYKSQDDMRKALFMTIDALQGKPANCPKGQEPESDQDGFYKIDSICDVLKSDPGLSYINRNHVVELFFKDKDRKILINGEDRIKYKEIKYVMPPDILYFGTLENLIPRMMTSGLHSSTKGYIKLYGTEERAKEFGSKFAERPSDKVVILKIDAKAAFTDGLRFSTYTADEFIVVRIDSKYILP